MITSFRMFENFNSPKFKVGDFVYFKNELNFGNKKYEIEEVHNNIYDPESGAIPFDRYYSYKLKNNTGKKNLFLDTQYTSEKEFLSELEHDSNKYNL